MHSVETVEDKSGSVRTSAAEDSARIPIWDVTDAESNRIQMLIFESSAVALMLVCFDSLVALFCFILLRQGVMQSAGFYLFRLWICCRHRLTEP